MLSPSRLSSSGVLPFRPTADGPPLVPWPVWYDRQPKLKTQKQHVLFEGPTQSGKTTLCRLLARIRSAVVVVGTKPFDESLDAYVEEGYVRIDHWPPTRADWKQNDGNVDVFGNPAARFILWPEINSRADLRSPRVIEPIEKLFDGAFLKPNNPDSASRFCIVVDEAGWISSKSGLNLGDALAAVAYSTASNRVSLYVLVQRITQVLPQVWTSCSWAEIFHTGRTDDVRELASLGTEPPRIAQEVVQRGLTGHRFLDLPCRGGARWAVSEVDPRWI